MDHEPFRAEASQCAVDQLPTAQFSNFSQQGGAADNAQPEQLTSSRNVRQRVSAPDNPTTQGVAASMHASGEHELTSSLTVGAREIEKQHLQKRLLPSQPAGTLYDTSMPAEPHTMVAVEPSMRPYFGPPPPRKCTLKRKELADVTLHTASRHKAAQPKPWGTAGHAAPSLAQATCSVTVAPNQEDHSVPQHPAPRPAAATASLHSVLPLAAPSLPHSNLNQLPLSSPSSAPCSDLIESLDGSPIQGFVKPMGRRQTPVLAYYSCTGALVLCLRDCISALVEGSIKDITSLLLTMKKTCFGSPGLPFHGHAQFVKHTSSNGREVWMAAAVDVVGIFNLHYQGSPSRPKKKPADFESFIAELQSHIRKVCDLRYHHLQGRSLSVHVCL